MASPFTIFRRYQKIMIAVTGVFAMIAFVFLDRTGMSSQASRNEDANNPVVVRTKYGAIRQSDLYAKIQVRALLKQFVGTLIMQKNYNKAREEVTRLRLNIPEEQVQMQVQYQSQQEAQDWGQKLFARSTTNQESEAVETIVLAKKAEELGMLVDNDIVNDFIRKITDNKVPTDEVLNIIENLQKQMRNEHVQLGPSGLFAAFGQEILASQLVQTCQSSINLAITTPGQRFDYYSRLHSKATVQLAGLNVASFVKVTGDPKESELKELYDKYKNRIPDPSQPEPGFQIPRMVKVAYFKIPVEPFIEKAKDQVTDEQIKEYYEREKDIQFRVSEDDKGLEEPKEGAGAKDADKKEADKKEEADKKDSDAKEPVKKDDSKSIAPAKGAAKPAQPKAASPAPPAGKAPAAPAPKKAAPAKSSDARRSTMTLVAQKNTPAPKGAPAAKGTAATPPPAAAADKTPAPSDVKEASPAAADKATDEKKPTGDVRYDPLVKVKDLIRDTLAREAGRKAMEETIGEIQAKMREYSQQLVFQSLGQLETPLKMPDFESLSKELQLEYKVFDEPMSAYDVYHKTDIGKSKTAAGSVPFVALVYRDEFPLFRPERTIDDDANYLFWKIEETPQRTPTFDEAKKEVLDAWKTQKARALAIKQANDYAQQARAAGKPLKEVFAGENSDVKVEESGPFTWLTEADVSVSMTREPQISEVDHVEEPGEAFMRTVFSLTEGKLDVSMNKPESIVYIVEMVKLAPSLEDLADEFARANTSFYMTVGGREMYQTREAWFQRQLKEADVHWERPPREDRRT